jgi:hypothetical protein
MAKNPSPPGNSDGGTREVPIPEDNAGYSAKLPKR